MNNHPVNSNILYLFFSILLISIGISSCNDKCDELAKEFNAFTVNIRPSFTVMEEHDGPFEPSPKKGLALQYEIFKMHCEGFASDAFTETGSTDHRGVMEIFQSFTCEIATPEDYVVLRLYEIGREDPFYEHFLFSQELREAQGFYRKNLTASFYEF